MSSVLSPPRAQNTSGREGWYTRPWRARIYTVWTSARERERVWRHETSVSAVRPSGGCLCRPPCSRITHTANYNSRFAGCRLPNLLCGIAKRWCCGVISISPRARPIEQKGVVLVGQKGYTMDKMGWPMSFLAKKGISCPVVYQQNGVVCGEGLLSAGFYPVLLCRRTKIRYIVCPHTAAVLVG